MLFVDELKRDYELYNLPERFVDVLPDSCPDCGSLMCLNETLTELSCSNPKCKSKTIMRIKSLCQDIGVLDFGESSIEKFIDTYEVTNPLNIFELEIGLPLYLGASDKVSEKVIRQIKSHNEFLLWELVMYANIPFVRSSARKIFQGYSCLSDAFEDIENGGVEFIQEKLGIQRGEGVKSIQAMKVYESLMANKEDLLEGERDVIIKSLDGVKELNVVCSDQVGGGFMKKADFYAYVNKTFDGRIHVNFLSSVSKSIDYLVWAGADGSPARYTSKVQKVERYNEKGSNIPIVSALQFIEEIESKY